MTPTQPDVRSWIAHLVSRGTTVEQAPPSTATLVRSWDDVRTRARNGRITGALHDVAVENAASLGAPRVAEARDLHRAAMATALLLERVLLDAHTRLADAGIPRLTLKGPAVAHLDHREPSDRDFGDIDLLVPAGRVGDAVDALAPSGFTRVLPSAHPRLDEVFGKSVTLHGDHGLDIDIHRTLTPGTFGLTLPLDRLWRMVEPFEVGGVELTALDGPARLLNTAVHLRLGSSHPQLSTHRDLLVQMDRYDVEDVVATAHELGLDAVLGAAIEQVESAGWPAPEPYRDWARSHGPSARDTERLRRHLAVGDDFGVQTRGLLRDLDRRDRALVVRALVLPRRAHLAARGLTRRQHIARLWTRRDEHP